ncbi:hypothetical protein NX862_01980 [Rhodobacter sp. KR11]|uniref:glycine zipper domain-containing protein n=1 Tax=Rhodobacter sp. KR11 TaxID=2974588 RepID=UPI0022236F5B|nr:hypothetical protein [Rhodobacter sp. KR11]MCW1917514.1 hypothetical protein [Rhodobacter sp. KR11]
MAQDPMTKTAADYEALVAQMSALRGDLVHLAEAVQKAALGSGKAVVQDVEASVTDAARYLGGKGHDADMAIERAVAANPYVALGLATGVGLLLGALARK